MRFVRDDRDTFRDVGSKAARMICVMVRVDDVLDRLVRIDLLDLANRRSGVRLVYRRLDEDHVVLELDEDASLHAGREEPDTVSDLLGLGRSRNGRTATHA